MSQIHIKRKIKGELQTLIENLLNLKVWTIKELLVGVTGHIYAAFSPPCRLYKSYRSRLGGHFGSTSRYRIKASSEACLHFVQMF